MGRCQPIAGPHHPKQPSVGTGIESVAQSAAESAGVDHGCQIA